MSVTSLTDAIDTALTALTELTAPGSDRPCWRAPVSRVFGRVPG